jgi:hypothetical protein
VVGVDMFVRERGGDTPRIDGGETVRLSGDWSAKNN